MKQISLIFPLLLLAGCAGTLQNLGLAPAAPVPDAAVPEAVAVVIPPPAVIGPSVARTAEALDTTTEAERVAALAPPAAAGAALGRVVVALGNVTEPGFWLRSALVGAPGKGRVEIGDASVAVDLLPGSGAAQLSLAAFRALGQSLTSLPEVTVYAD